MQDMLHVKGCIELSPRPPLDGTQCQRRGDLKSMMTPREFLTAIVQPNIAELDADDANVRKAINVVNALDNLVGQMFVTLSGKGEISGTDTQMRDYLADGSPDYRLIRDLALALKHGQIDRKTPVLKVADVSSTELMMRDWHSLSDVRHMAGPHAIVETGAGDKRVLVAVAEAVSTFLEMKMVEWQL